MKDLDKVLIKPLKKWQWYSIFVDFGWEALGRLQCEGNDLPTFYAVLHILIKAFEHNKIEMSQIGLDDIHKAAQFWMLDTSDMRSICKVHPLWVDLNVQVSKLNSQEKSTHLNSPN